MRFLASKFNNAVINAMYKDLWRCDIQPDLFIAVRSVNGLETFWLYVGQDSRQVFASGLNALCKKIDAVVASHRRSWKAGLVSESTMSEAQLVSALEL